MFRLLRSIGRAFVEMFKQFFQAINICRRVGYIILLVASSFLVQLHICLYLADAFDILEITSKGGFYPLSDWSMHAERFLVCCGAFLWLIYILPNRQGVSPWAKGVWSKFSPILVAGLHLGLWIVVWGPLANLFSLYKGMSLVGALACLWVLIEIYTVQVWQDIVQHIIKTQKIRAERLRYVDHFDRKEEVSSYL